ncbi:MAG TPA: Rpn family recombination-promoting nuclease/putative transposase [Desulfohalobiaceae bacterium]|nr:Rpn family recombination-promoting nuclease/putative transposase [Desulfohalobiaceae bacterium]
MAKQKRSPHSEFFTDIMGRKENAQNLLKKALPEDIQEQLDLDSLRVEKGSYVDEDQKKHFSDLIFSLNLKKGDLAKVYCLLEHKSTPEVMVSLQVLRYMVLEWHNIVKQREVVGQVLPPIIPIVVYQGHQRWNVGRDFHSIIDFPSDSFKVLVPNFEYLLWNLTGVDDRKLQDALILRYYVLICKALGSEELSDYLFELVEAFCKTLDSQRALEYIEIFFRYIAKASAKVTKKDFEDALSKLPQGGEKVMNTLAEQWIQEGEQRILKKKDKWIDQGKIQNSQEMLIEYIQDELDIPSQKLIDKIRSIKSYDLLRGLFRKARKVNSLDEFAREMEKVL